MSDKRSGILVVEDDHVNRMSLVRLLQSDGLPVDSADCVAVALEKLSAKPKIILLDINLPDGSGAEILHHIRSNDVPAKVCILTGSVDVNTLEGLKRMEPDAIFLKPVHAQEIVRWVNEAQAE